MYDLGPEFEHATVDPGTNILLSGPPLSGKRLIAMRLLAAGARQGEGSVIVTTRDSADRVMSDYRSILDDPDEANIGIVDCVTKHQGQNTEDSSAVKYASSPVDMTGIGIKFSEFVEHFYSGRGLEQNRIALDSLSALLMYSDLQTVFRFMHVFTSRIEDANGLGVHVLDSTAHDAETMNTMKQLFDGVVRTTEDKAVSLEFPGLDADIEPPIP